MNYKEEANQLDRTIRIEDLARQYYDLVKAGKDFIVSNDPSIKISPSKNIIKDFSGHSDLGSNAHQPVSFYMLKTGLLFIEAVKQLSGDFKCNADYKEVTEDKTESPKDVSEICKLIAKQGTLTEAHQLQYSQKRNFSPNKNNFFSLTHDLINLIKPLDRKVSNDLLYYKNKGYDLIILERNQDNEPISLRLYSFTNTKAKKITLSNIERLGLYGKENITSSTKRIIFTEGEDKADLANKYAPPETVFLSIPGITSTGKAIEFIEKNPNYEYFILLDQENRDVEPKAVRRFISQVQKLEAENITIKALDIPEEALSNNSKLGIDDYLVLFSEGERPANLQKILDDCYTLKEYINKYESFLKEVELERRKIKTSWGNPTIKNNRDGIDINDYKTQKILLNQAKNHLENGEGLAVFTPPPGSGKSYTSEILLQQYDLIFQSFNRLQRNEIAVKSGSTEILSVIEKIDNVLNSYISMSTEKKESIKTLALKLIELGHSPKLIPTLSQLELDQNTLGSLSMTFLKGLCTQNKHLEAKEGLLIDESPLSQVIKSCNINYDHLKKLDNYYRNPKLSILLKCLINIIEDSGRTLEGKNLYKEIERRLKKADVDLELLISEIISEPDKTNKSLTDSIRESKSIDSLTSLINSLPNKNHKTALIFALKNKFKSSCFEAGKIGFNDGIFSIDFLIEADLKGKPAILMDATANPIIVSAIFPSVKVTEYKENIYIPGIHYTLVADKTYSTASLYEDMTKSKLKETFLKIVMTIAGNDKTLLVVSKEIEDFIEKNILLPENIVLVHYFGNSKASNDYKDCKKVIALPPKVNYENIIRIAKVLYPDVDNYQYDYKEVFSGHVDPATGKGFYFEQIQFKNKKVQALLEQFREAEVYQALFRIKRDSEDKEFFVLGNIDLKCFGLIPDKILMSNEIVPKKSDQKISTEVDFLEHILLENLHSGKFILNSELMKKFYATIAETQTTRGYPIFSNNIYIILEDFRVSSDSNDYSDTLKNRTLQDHYRKIRNKLLDKLGFITPNFPTIENNKESIILKSSDDLEEAKQYYSRLEMIRPGKQLNSFSQIIGTQYLHTEIKEINCFTLPEAYNLYPQFTGYEERSFNFMSEQMLLFYKDNQLTPGKSKEPLTNLLLNNFSFDTPKAEKFVNRFLADIEPSTNDILPMESLPLEFNQPMEALTINLPRTDKNSPYYDSLNAEIIPGGNNYLKKAKDTSKDVRAILIERGNQPKLELLEGTKEAPKMDVTQCINQVELEHSTIKALGNVFDSLYFEDYIMNKDINQPQKELEHISSILEVLFPNNIQMLKDIPEAPLKVKNFMAYAKGNFTYLLREFKPILLRTIAEGKLLTKEGLSKRFNPDLEKIPEYSNKYYYQLFMCIQFTANMDIINKIITDKKLKNILLTSTIRFENVADLKIKYG